MPDDSSEVVVTQSNDRDRFEITVENQQAGFAEYVDRDVRRIFHHTEIGEDFGGRGLGSTLISRALADTHAAGLRIVPVCPFVRKYLERHHEVADIVDNATPDALEAVRERTG